MIFGLNPEDVIAALAGIAAFFSVIAVWYAGLARDPMQGRLKILEERRVALRAGYVAPKKRRNPVNTIASVGLMRRLVRNTNLFGAEQTRKAAEKLAKAGWRTKDSVTIFFFFKLVLPLVALVAALIMVYGLKMGDFSPFMRAVVTMGSILLGWAAPDLLVRNATLKRQDALRKSMPDALDLLVICTEAGLSLDAALKRVSIELGKSFPELADEFTLTSIELGFLPDRSTALGNLAKRVDIPAMRSVVATLSQTEKYGTPLSQSLRVLSAEFRNERMMKAEEKAARLPAILTVPLILFILPSLFIVLMGPAILDLMDNFVNR